MRYIDDLIKEIKSSENFELAMQDECPLRESLFITLLTQAYFQGRLDVLNDIHPTKNETK